MKEKYLEELRKALEENNIEAEEIVDTYAKRFDLGYEAEMTDEEIIEMLGSVDDVLTKFNPKSTTGKKRWNCNLDFANLFSDFTIVTSKKAGISFQFAEDDEIEKYVEIKNSEDEISLKANNLIKRKHFEGTMVIGPDVCFDKFVISGAHTDLRICDLNVNSFKFNLISGDAKIANITALESAYVSIVTGDIVIDSLKSPNATISTTSGDIVIDEITADSVKLNTISGDIIINRSNEAVYKISTVSGDVAIKNGADISLVSSTSVSGDVTISGKASGKTISDAINKVFKDIKIF